MRAAMNAIFYLLRTGCPWRYLPRDPFPPRSTVYNIFRKFQREGVWERIWEELLVALREQRGREASPTAAIIDSQSLKAAEKGGAKAGVKTTQWVMTPARVRPDGAYHLWRKIPSGKLSIGLEADERFSRVTGWTEAS